MRTVAAAVALAAFPLVAALLPVAQAFTSVPDDTSAHDRITAAAARPAGFDGEALEALRDAVRRPDLDETKVDRPGGDHVVILDAAADYEPAHHCDRIPPADDFDALNQTVAYVRLERAQALQFARAGHPERAVRALGNALHALQDCFSHSDVVDRDAAAQAALVEALTAGGPIPRLRLCSIQPGAENAEFPPGDPYPHGRYAKDEENLTDDARALLADGRTKFAAAFGLAVGASRLFLESFVAELAPQQRATLFAAESAVPVLAPPPGLAAGAVILLAAAAARRRSP